MTHRSYTLAAIHPTTIGRALLAPLVLLTTMLAPSAASAEKPERTDVDADIVIGITEETATGLTLAALVTGEPFGRAGASGTATSDGAAVSGPLAIFDGRGSVRGTLTSSLDAQGHLSGGFVAENGKGAYRHAGGTLAFSGFLDSTSVFGVTVVRGTLDGQLRVEPGEKVKRARGRLSVHFAGQQAKVQTVPMDDWIELTFAATTDPVGIGPGVPLVVSRVVPEPVRAQSWKFYGSRGTWRATGVVDLDSDEPTELTVTGGSGRYRKAHGKLSYLATDPDPNGVVNYTLDGRLRFPAGGS